MSATEHEDLARSATYVGGRIAIGRSNINDLVLASPDVTGFHAEIVRVGDVLELHDLGTRQGTLLNGRPVTRSVIRDRDVIGIGPYSISFDGSRFQPAGRLRSAQLVVDEVTVLADARPILDRAGFSVEAGELVCIIGESGSGKSTLLRTLAGVNKPSSGSVTLGGEPVRKRLTEIGYVPQDEIVHRDLTIREALNYSGRLRLPKGIERSERKATIERVLAELSLTEHASKRIGLLSGGQRKRAGVASELLNRPSLLCLDEPTTGLDPGLEAQMMQLFRDLADPEERAVVVVTHATASLDICDKLAVFSRGGVLAFYGPPRQALAFFEVDSYDEVYARLLSRKWTRWQAPDELQSTTVGAAEDGAEHAPVNPRPRPGMAAQAAVLSGRYLRLFRRDIRNLAILFGQVPLIALAAGFLFQVGLFDQSVQPGAKGDPRYAIQLLFILATTAIWFGAITSAREIVKERAVIAREAAIGVGWTAYLLSKGLILSAVVSLQTGLLTYTVLVIRPLDESPSVYIAVSALLILTSVVAVTLGLLVSATVRTQEQATSFIPLTLIPQLLFAGALIPVAKMGEPIASLSNLVMARWALAGVGSLIDMNSRIAGDRALAKANDYGDSFFAIRAGQASVVLLAFMAVFTLLTLVVLVRRGRSGTSRPAD